MKTMTKIMMAALLAVVLAIPVRADERGPESVYQEVMEQILAESINPNAPKSILHNASPALVTRAVEELMPLKGTSEYVDQVLFTLLIPFVDRVLSFSDEDLALLDSLTVADTTRAMHYVWLYRGGARASQLASRIQALLASLDGDTVILWEGEIARVLTRQRIPDAENRDFTLFLIGQRIAQADVLHAHGMLAHLVALEYVGLVETAEAVDLLDRIVRFSTLEYHRMPTEGADADETKTLEEARAKMAVAIQTAKDAKESLLED